MCTPEDVANCERMGGCVMHGSSGSCPPGFSLRLENPAHKEYRDLIKKQGIKCPHCGKWVLKPKQLHQGGVHMSGTIVCKDCWKRRSGYMPYEGFCCDGCPKLKGEYT